MTRCTCLTQKGDQCKKDAIQGSSMCSIHSKKCGTALPVGASGKKVATVSKKAPAKKTVAKKAPAKRKTGKTAKKAPAKKVAAKKAAAKKSPVRPMNLPESERIYLDLVRLGKVSAPKKTAYKKLQALKSIEDVEMSGDTTIHFVIHKDLPGDNETGELEQAERDIGKVLKGIPHMLDIDDYDEERLRWDGRIIFKK